MNPLHSKGNHIHSYKEKPVKLINKYNKIQIKIKYKIKMKKILSAKKSWIITIHLAKMTINNPKFKIDQTLNLQTFKMKLKTKIKIKIIKM